MKRILAITAALALVAPQAFAGSFADAMNSLSQFKQGNLKIGNAEIHPWYGISEMYDSNIYDVPQDQANGVVQGGGVRSAWITKNDLGLGFKLPVSGMHSFDGMYDFNANDYSKQGNINDYVEQRANLGYGYKGPMGLTGRLADTYLNTADPAFSELAGKRSKRWQNVLNGKLDYAPEGGRLNGGVSFNQENDKYLDGVTFGPLLNRYEQTYGVNVGYMVQPKTKVWTGYRRQIIHYTDHQAAGDDKDNKSHFIDFGVDGVLAPKVKGSITTGLQLRRYDQNSANRTGYTRNWIIAGQTVWDAMGNGDCLWTLNLSRALQESTFSNNRFYIANNASLGIKHKLPYKLTARVDLGVEVDRYPEASTAEGMTRNRRDDIYTEGVGLDYAVQQWLALSLDYRHAERNSTFPGTYNYEDHQTTVGAKLMF